MRINSDFILISGLNQRELHDRLLLPDPARHRLHVLRRAHAQDPRGL